MAAVFLDRDGTIGGTGGGVHPLDFTLYAYAANAIRKLNEHNIKVFLLTNQSWVGMGKFTEEELLLGFQRMQETLKREQAFLDGIYYCPHSPDDHCVCRKPSPFLLFQAEAEHGLHLDECYVVGDRTSDLQAANAVQAKKILVLTGRGTHTLERLKRVQKDAQPDVVATDVLKTVEFGHPGQRLIIIRH
ncbi:D-glycero-D-manno-heptose 1,7-bisphosphate phosphatase [Pullulanibacillus pueri]|uniref:D,D-heptose 1,7-bisphosphate phosphatase n=1 Tax=Pullulanibacillus pueri TaxID=1437324 RepID=A0A8J2ZYT7_9BACL|nr:HAD-IIIA family hydrolase [Pullulanibacillus pueri]MBM7683765.1 D-glycero-D-manno-heptose 1,7-bisphosphate phosphatase [Pullulanibacillus pueri]GGH87308.1 hypothetical protein GCM10007096_37030 [Pullulanibacillus pueri]